MAPRRMNSARFPSSTPMACVEIRTLGADYDVETTWQAELLEAKADARACLRTIRRGRDTRFLTFEQLMRLNEGSHRSMYLRLLEIDAGFPAGRTKRVYLKTPTMLDLDGRQYPYRPESGVLRFDAVLESIDSDKLDLKMMPNA